MGIVTISKVAHSNSHLTLLSTIISTYRENTTMKTTPKEKMIINLMEEVINILSTCKLGDPEFDMYDVMKDAVEKEVRYPLYD